MSLSRRNFLVGILAAAVAPAFIRTQGLLMPIKPLIVIPDEATMYLVSEVAKEASKWEVKRYLVDWSSEWVQGGEKIGLIRL